MLNLKEAEALDAWAFLVHTDKPWHHVSPHGHRYEKRAPNEHYMWQVVDAMGIAPRWLARAVWPYMGTAGAQRMARKVSHNRAACDLGNLMAEKTASKIGSTKSAGSLQMMSKLIHELQVDNWTTARKLRRAGLMMPADLVGMTASPMNRNTIRKRLDDE